MRPELFTIRPELDGPQSAADFVSAKEGTITVAVTAPPVLLMECAECDWSFRYTAIALPGLLAHVKNHSALHPQENGDQQ